MAFATEQPQRQMHSRVSVAVREWHGHDAERSPARAAFCPASGREGCNGRENSPSKATAFPFLAKLGMGIRDSRVTIHSLPYTRLRRVLQKNILYNNITAFGGGGEAAVCLGFLA